MTSHPLLGCKASLATAHGKAAAIAPVLRSRLDIEIIVPAGLDTDSLGTFTGEVARVGTMEDALVRKARLGLEATGLTLGIASEGSYGPHPHIPFIGAGLEQMILIDTVLGYRVQESLFDNHPVFESAEIDDITALPPLHRTQLLPQPCGHCPASRTGRSGTAVQRTPAYRRPRKRGSALH